MDAGGGEPWGRSAPVPASVLARPLVSRWVVALNTPVQINAGTVGHPHRTGRPPGSDPNNGNFTLCWATPLPSESIKELHNPKHWVNGTCWTLSFLAIITHYLVTLMLHNKSESDDNLSASARRLLLLSSVGHHTMRSILLVTFRCCMKTWVI